MQRATVGVVGAGITGLAATHHLAAEGVDVVTFEAAADPGGVIASLERDGHVLEVGPQRVRLTPGVEALVADVGLRERLLEADESLPLFVYADGRLREAPFDRWTFLRTDLLSWRGKLRLLAEPLTDAGDPAESVAEVFTRKFGREAYERFVGPLYGGIYGSDPAEMPARYALADLLDREEAAGSMLSAFRGRVGGGRQFPPVSFPAGLQALPAALFERHADRVRLETPVEAVSAAEGQGARYVLDTAAGRWAVDHVVVTTPADVTADLLAGVVPGAGGLADLTYNPLAMVYLEASADREGFGYQVALDADLRTLGASWNASMFDRDGLYTVFMGGMHDPEILERDDDAVAAVAAREFEAVMDAPATVCHVARLDRGFPAYDGSWAGLADLSTPEGVHLATNYTARMGVPSRVREAREVAEAIADGA